MFSRNFFVASFFLLSFFIPFSAFSQQQGQGISFGIGPTLDNDRYPGWFIYEAKPGSTFQDEATVVNLSDETITLRLYPQDALNNVKSGKGFEVPNEGQTPENKKHLNSWVRLSQDLLTLLPKEEKKVAFTVTIPVQAKKMEYPGVIFAHLDPLATRNSNASSQMNANVGTRVGVRIYLTVTDTPSMPGRFLAYSPVMVVKYLFFGILGLFLLFGSYSLFRDPRQVSKKKNISHI